MVIVQELSMVSVKTCSEFSQYFVRRVEHLASSYCNVHLVFDRYDHEQSLKQRTRVHRYGQAADSYHFVVNDNTQIKVPFKKFISSSKTKDQLTVYLANKTLRHFEKIAKTIVTATTNGAQSNDYDVSYLSSNHEEADTLLILHASHASNRGQTVHILSPDTDVFILAVRRLRQLGENTCMIVGTGEKRRIVPIKPVHDAVGSTIAEALPGFHAFTGCDTTGKFTGKGKVTCWNTLTAARPNVIRAFGLGETNELSQNTFDALEEFVCRLYCLRSAIVNISDLRWYLFKKNQAEAEKLPPTRATLRNHTLRAHYQAMVWANDIIPKPVLPSPLNYGWTLDGTTYTAVTSDLPPAPSAVVELVKCGCTTSVCATSSCSCRKNCMACTELCVCGSGDDGPCENQSSGHVMSGDESDLDESEEDA